MTGAEKALMAALNNKKLEIVAGAYRFFIRCGVRDSENVLIEALSKWGNKMIATDFLNCGNSVLEEAAKHWAYLHQYRIFRQQGNSDGPHWGRT